MMSVFDIFNNQLPNLPIVENLKLALNQYLSWDKKIDARNKVNLLRLSKKWKYQRGNADNLRKMMIDYQSRHQAIVQSLRHKVFCAKFTTSSRLVVGLGNPNPSENGLTFHHVYGFPLIPGSAQKGVCSHYAKEFEDLKETDPIYQEIFGNQAQKGNVIFMDAFPLLDSDTLPERLLDLDIMNPHYQEYYGSQGKIAPGDYLSPNPIEFLAVGPGVPFQFTLIMLFDKDNNILHKAAEWLISALEIIGIGGKTHLGYGRFCLNEDKIFNG